MIELQEIVLFVSFIILISFRVYTKSYQKKINPEEPWFKKLENQFVFSVSADFFSLYIINKFLIYLFNPWLAALNILLLLPFLIKFKYQKLTFLLFIFYFHDFYLFFNQDQILKADLGLILFTLLALFIVNQSLSRKVLILSIMLISTKANIPFTSLFLSIASIVLFIDGLKLLQKNHQKPYTYNIYTILSDLYILSFIVYSHSFTKSAIIFFALVLVIRYFYDSLSKKIDLYFLILSRFTISLLVFESNQNQVAIFLFYLILWFFEIKSFLKEKKLKNTSLLDKIILRYKKNSIVAQLPIHEYESTSLNYLKHQVKRYDVKEKHVEYLSSASVDRDLLEIVKKSPEYLLVAENINEYYQVKIWVQDFYQLEKQLSSDAYLLKQKMDRSELTFMILEKEIEASLLKLIEENIHEMFPYAQFILVDNLNSQFHFNEHIVLIKKAVLFRTKKLIDLFLFNKNLKNEQITILPNYKSVKNMKELLSVNAESFHADFLTEIKLQTDPFNFDQGKYNYYQRYCILANPDEDIKLVDAQNLIFIGDLDSVKSLIKSKKIYAYDLVLCTEIADYETMKHDYGILSIEYIDSETSSDQLTVYLDKYFDTDQTMLTSIIIPYFNNGFYTYQCIKSIQANTSLPYEILLIDNASTDKWPTRLKAMKGIRYYRNKTNLGFAGAVNTGLRLAKGNYLLILNNDVIVSRFWLENLLKPVQRGELDLVGPISNEISGPQKVNLAYNGLDEYHIKSKHYTKANGSKLMRTDRVVGFCMLFKREIFNDIGYFDERYEIGNFEDDDYCLRLKTKHYRMGFTHACYIHHYGSLSFKQNQFVYNDILNINREKFLEKWSYHLKKSNYSIYQLIKDISVLQAKEVFQVNSNQAFDIIYHNLSRKGRLIHYIELSNMLLMRKYHDEALKLLDSAIESYSENILLQIYRWNLLYDLGALKQADMKIYTETKSKVKNHANSYYIECCELLKNGRIDDLSSVLEIIEIRDPFSDFSSVFKRELAKMKKQSA
jgi:GT2 family glycosyltransferase